MAASGGGSLSPPPPATSQEVFQWLKNLPLAPEYHPTLAEFQDPISYIFKIEKEASKYGICKIVPPVPSSSKKTAISNLNRSLAARSADKSQPTFTTRQQQIGFCPRKPRPVQKPVWQSGENYTFQEFEAKAKAFEKSYLKRCSKKGTLSALDVETLYWKATVDKPFSVEYANDMPGSAFSSRKSGGKEGGGEGVTVGDTEWNMRGVSRAKGSLLRFMKEEIPGVTSPMVYIAMLFSWFAWHVEDHDLHSLNYLHMGAGKTWYGVPRDAAVAFEEVVRVHGYGGEINPLVTFAVLGEKTTVISPQVFVKAGVPCCRLVQNAGEFVVTFPRAYHSGFSLGFNCGEAANIATPEWLRIAKDAAIRRASINYPPMVSHFQLLYDLALELCTRVPESISSKPRSSRLKDKQKGEGESLVKDLFVKNIVHNNSLLHFLGNGSSIVILPPSSSEVSLCSNFRVGSQLKVSPSLGLCSHKGIMKSLESSVVESIMSDRNNRISQKKGYFPVKGKFDFSYENKNTQAASVGSEIGSDIKGVKLADQRLFSCVTCGILNFDCVAIVQPRDVAARYLMSADCSFLNDWIVGSGVTTDGTALASRDGLAFESTSSKRELLGTSSIDAVYDGPVKNVEAASGFETQREASALGLLAQNYGNSSDSEEDPDASHSNDETDVKNLSESKHNLESSALPCFKQESCDFTNGSHVPSPSRPDQLDGVSFRTIDFHANDGRRLANFKDISNQPPDCGVPFDTINVAYQESSSLECKFSDRMLYKPSNISPVVHDSEKPKFNMGIMPIENTISSFAHRSDEDSSRMHVFCLEHAVEVEQQLRPIGGANIFLLCHPEYPRIESQAKLSAEEMGIDYIWNELTYRDATKEDEGRIQSALDSEEAMPGNGDWAVKLGINLFYSSNLSQSPLYSKQMPYNLVIYNAFGRTSLASSPKKFNVYGRRAAKQRKVVAGRWCGKVWMSNQVHPFLAKKDSEDQDEQEQERSCRDEKPERTAQSMQKAKTTLVTKKLGKKRKVTLGTVSAKKVQCMEMEDALSEDLAENDFYEQPKKLHSSKRTKGFEREASYDSLNDSSHQQHGRIQRRKQAKSVEIDDAASDDSLEDDSHQQYKRVIRSKEGKRIQRENVVSYVQKQHRRIPKSKQAKFVGREATVSEDSMEEDSYSWQERVPRIRQGKFSKREYEFSDDSLGESSGWPRNGSKRTMEIEKEDSASDDSFENSPLQQLRRRTSRRDRLKLIEQEDAISNDSLEANTYQQNVRFSRSRQGKLIERENAVSDDSFNENYHQQQRRIPRSKQSRFVEREDDSLEDDTHLHHRRIPRNKKAKFVESEDVISDDSLGNISHQQYGRTIPRGKKAKFTDSEDVASDDAEEENVYQQSRKTTRGKKLSKFSDGEDAVSDDMMELHSTPQNRRILRSKQKRPMTIREMKRQTSQQVKRGTTLQPIKKETLQSIKQERQMKKHETPRSNNKSERNAREFDSHFEEEQEGGPSTRLRKRPSKPPKESQTKPKQKQQQQSGKKKVKNAVASVKPAGSRKNAKVKDEEAEYQCDIDGCTMSFGSKQELAVHKRNICPVKGCGKKFFSHKYLVQHRRVHLDDRPLKCPWKGCKMSFKWAWARTEHIRVHTGARPYVCSEEGCGQTFRFVSDFSRHKRKTGHSVKKGRG